MLWQLVLVELIIMGATSGIAVALGRSAPPQPTTFAPDASPAFILSGYELPPELTPERWLTEWRLDWLWVAVAVFGLVSYFLGIRKVLQRGRLMVLVPDRQLGDRSRGPDLRDLRAAVGLWPGAVLGAHGGPHGPDHGGPALPGPGRPRDAGAAGADRRGGTAPAGRANGC